MTAIPDIWKRLLKKCLKINGSDIMDMIPSALEREPVCFHNLIVSDEVILAFYEKRQNIQDGGFPNWYRGLKTTCSKCPRLFIHLPYPLNPFVEIEIMETITSGEPSHELVGSH